MQAAGLQTHQGHIWEATTNCFGKENTTECYTYKDSKVMLSLELQQAQVC